MKHLRGVACDIAVYGPELQGFAIGFLLVIAGFALACLTHRRPAR